MADAEPRLYRFDPPDTSGIFLGLGPLQCVLVGAGLFAAVAALSAGAPLAVAAVPPSPRPPARRPWGRRPASPDSAASRPGVGWWWRARGPWPGPAAPGGGWRR